jgi:hypothetical protein
VLIAETTLGAKLIWAAHRHIPQVRCDPLVSWTHVPPPNAWSFENDLLELLALGHSDAEYDAWLIRLDRGDQFGSGFAALNPNLPRDWQT